MMSGDEDKSLSRLSTFAIQKGIEGLVGEPKNIKRLRSGDLLIEVDRETYSTKLLAIKEIAGIPVKVSPHRTLNTSKGVIRTQEIKNTTNEELKAQLKRQGVSDARIITIKKNGDTIKLNTAVLTLNFPKPPADIKVGFELCPIQLYIPHPLRCFRGTGMIASSSTFRPHPGRVIRDLFRLLDAVTALYGSTSLQQSSKGSCSLLVSGYNLRADCQWRTLVPPFNSGANAAPASVLALM